MRNSITVILLLTAFFCHGQFATVNGSVKSKNGEGVSFAHIYFPNLKMGTSANANGDFEIEKIPFGKHQVVISSLGYTAVIMELNVDQSTESVPVSMKKESQELPAVDINEQKNESLIASRLRNIEGTYIYTAKKNELIELNKISANLSSNNSRQVFARVPGINVWESDCAGLQLGVGARGLSPDRTSNFNTRQNGYDMAADALGYPESYYAPPMQALERIEIVRGAASLQYGTQFGGMINLRLKSGNPDKVLSGRTINTYNSVGNLNTFNELGGQSGKLNYYGFVNYRAGDCNCPNTDFEASTSFLKLGYEFSSRLRLTTELTYMSYLAQQAGGLTDFQFEEDPFQSLRSRNWFEVKWLLASINLDYDITDQTSIETKLFGLSGSRKAVGFLQTPNRLDLQPFEARDLLVDYYNNIGMESRMLHRYTLLDNPSAFLIGVRAYKGNTQKAQGYGSTASDANFNFQFRDSLNMKSDYRFPSYNVALFTENTFNLSSKFSITPGIRYEFIRTTADGYYDSSVRIPNTNEIVIDSITNESRERNRSILLAGIGLAYQINERLETYANFSQNYRAITFNDIRVVNPSAAVDPDLQDEKGFNLDLGLRGQVVKGLNIDAGVFWLHYEGKIGSVLTPIQSEFFGQRLVRYTTNVADANVQGIESYIEGDLNELCAIKSEVKVSIFANLAYTRARYRGAQESAIEGKKVENVPEWNFKTGLQSSYKDLKLALQYSFISSQYSEGTNAETSPTGVYGIIPSYWVVDLSIDYSWKWLLLEGGINNLTDNTYFTRRSTGYPGPGIIPASPRNYYIGVGIAF